MPTHYTGTFEDRLARLDKTGRRCDGNNRNCIHGAIEEHALRPAKNGEPIPDAEMVKKQSCSRHRQQFVNNVVWVVVSSRRFPKLHESANAA